MTDRRRIEYTTSMDSRGFSDGTRTVGQKLGDLKNDIQNKGIVGLGQLSQFIGYSVSDLFTLGRKAGETVYELALLGEKAENVAMSFDKVFTPAIAQDLRDELDETRRSMGLSKLEMEGMVLPLGQAALNAGFLADEAAELTGKFFTIAGDVAAFNPQAGDATSALQAMQGALRGEFDPLEKFGSKLSAARISAEKARLLGVDPLNESLSAQQLEIIAVKNLIEKDLALAMGTLAEQEGTAIDNVNELKSAWGDFKITMGQQIMPEVVAVTGAAADTVEGNWLGAAGNVLSFFSNQFDRGLKQVGLDFIVDSKNRTGEYFGLWEGALTDLRFAHQQTASDMAKHNRDITRPSMKLVLDMWKDLEAEINKPLKPKLDNAAMGELSRQIIAAKLEFLELRTILGGGLPGVGGKAVSDAQSTWNQINGGGTVGF